MEKTGSVMGSNVTPQSLPLGKLLFRSDRWSVLPTRARRALAGHIGRGGPYPPVIVRPHPRKAGRFEVLDGHNRAEILRELGHDRVRCEVWPVTDEQADVLAVSLNGLRGRPDHRRRARAVQRLLRRLGPDRAAEALGATPAGLEQCVRALDRPASAAEAPGLDLRPVVFHLPPQEAAEVERTLARRGSGQNTRGQALLAAVRASAGPAQKAAERAVKPKAIRPNEPNPAKANPTDRTQSHSRNLTDRTQSTGGGWPTGRTNPPGEN